MIAADFHAQNSGNNDTSKNAAESDAHCANVMLIVQVCFLRLALPTSGLARRGRRRGGLRDGPARRERHRRSTYCCCWKVALHPPLSAGPAGGWPCGSGTGGAPAATPLAADFGPGPEGAAEGRAAEQGVCFVRLAPPTSGLARRGRQTSYARPLVPTPSETVDQTLPP